ncbi:MAG: IS4 family transposase [Desulfobacterales bacterium]|nr:IS4 family transposase [Desulfobacterales bacterium]
MGFKNTIFKQILQIFPRHKFEKIVKKHNGDFASKGFSCWNQFVAMLFAQLSGQTGLRGIENGLLSNSNSLYHLGVTPVKRSTLSYANNNRPSVIYENVFNELLSIVKPLNNNHKHKFKNKLYSIDATTIDLCLSLFPWADFRSKKGGIKLNVKLDHSGYIPSFVSMTTARKHELDSLRKMQFNKGDIITFDRAYTDFKLFANYCSEGIYFVTRLKKNADYKVIERRDTSKYQNVSSDQIIEMTGFYTKQKCPLQLRRIRCKDPETGKFIVILTNIVKWAPTTVSKIYKDRWQIEIFFKTIKQNMKIQKFLGNSRNAVMIQVWIALIAYLLLQYFKNLSLIEWTHNSLMKLIPVILMIKKDIWDILNKAPPKVRKTEKGNLQRCLL